MQTCQWDIGLEQAGTRSIVQASANDGAGNITNFTENRTSKFLFFSRFKRDVFFNFCVCHKKGVSGKHPIREPIHIMYVFIKGIIEKTNCYWQVRYFFDLYSVGKYKKQNNISAISAIYPLYHTISATHKKREEKNYLKIWIVARRPQLNYQEK